MQFNAILMKQTLDEHRFFYVDTYTEGNLSLRGTCLPGPQSWEPGDFFDPWLDPPLEAPLPDTVFYTNEVINTHSKSHPICLEPENAWPP